MQLQKSASYIAILLALSLSACSPGKNTTSASAARRTNQPQFIDDIALSGGGNSHVTVKSLSRRKAASVARNNAARKASSTENSESKNKYADLLQVTPEDLDNPTLYKFLEDWIGVHYRYGGTDKEGIDCSAFVQRTYADVYGVTLVRTALEQYNIASVVRETGQLHEGDLVFFKINSSRISHVGIYLANNFFVHASITQGVMISSLNETYWKKYYAGGGVLIARN